MAVWETFKTNGEWEQYLKRLLKSDDRALARAIVLIYNNQTPEEKQTGKSIEDNQIGFTKWDAKELGTIAKKIKQKQPLTEAELAKSRNKMVKYWRQLMVISKAKMSKKAEQMAEAKLAEDRRVAEEYFRSSINAMVRCSEGGIACDYGICDECPVTCGLQMRLM